jgi:hypothetical protein
MSDESTNPAPASAPGSSFKFDAKRWTKIDRNVGIATFVFFISLFLPWFGYNIAIYSVTVDGLWHGYMYLTLFIAIGIVAYLVLLAGMEKLPFSLPLPHGRVLMLATGVNFLLALISFLTKPSGGAGWRYGAFIGLIASAVAFAPFAIPAIQTARAAKSPTS